MDYDAENIILADTITGAAISRRVFRTDSSINLGDSGGPIYGTDGKVYGIVCAKTTRTGVDNMGYGVHSNVAVCIADRVIEDYENAGDGVPVAFYRPLVGVTIYIKSGIAVLGEDGKVDIHYDICVSDVTEGSLCDGLIEVGDYIRKVRVNDGEFVDVYSNYDMIATVMTANVGDTVTIIVENSDGEPRDPISVVIDADSLSVEHLQ